MMKIEKEYDNNVNFYESYITLGNFSHTYSL